VSLSGQAGLVRLWQQMEQLHAIRKRRAQAGLRRAQQQVRDLQQAIATTQDELDLCPQWLQQAQAQFVTSMRELSQRSLQSLDQVAAIRRERETLLERIAMQQAQLAQARQTAAELQQQLCLAEQRGQQAGEQLRASRRKWRDLQEEREG